MKKILIILILVVGFSTTIHKAQASFLGDFLSQLRSSLPASVITSSQVLQTRATAQDIAQLETKLANIDASIGLQTKILDNSLLSKIIPTSIVSKDTLGKAIDDKNKLIISLSSKSPKDAITFIEKNNLVGKVQLVGTPVTKITKTDVVVNISPDTNTLNYLGTYTDSIVTKTIFADQFNGLDGQYKISKFTGYQFGDSIIAREIT